MSTTHEQFGDVFVVQPGERLDADTGEVFEAAVEEVFRTGGRQIVVDLSRVEYVSSFGLGGFVKSAKNARPHRARIVLAGLTGKVAEVFEVSGIVNLFRTFDGRDEAIAWFEEDGE